MRALGDEFQVLRVDLIIVLRLLAGKDNVERDLIALVHDRPVAAGHFADVKVRDAGNALQEFVSAGDHRLGGFRFGRVGPKNDNVTELSDNLCYI